MLRQYNLLHREDFTVAPWSEQYCAKVFPKYWELTYSILRNLDKNYSILEIGCGLGNITAIMCYLGYEKVTAFEKDARIGRIAQRRISDMFGRKNVVHNENYPNSRQYIADVLILVNCAYADLAKTKQEYLNLIKEYYVSANYPRYYLIEVIDSSYTKEDIEFPEYIRLGSNDVKELFPDYEISSWETYKYPINRKSKTLYLIERK
jgi:protein-L-isoaspartate(D-aspartate) O-methyltransferase